MLVKEAIALLQGMPPDARLIMAKDGEGNGYSPCCEITKGTYSPDSTWSGEYAEEVEPSQATDKKQLAVCLHPVN